MSDWNNQFNLREGVVIELMKYAVDMALWDTNRSDARPTLSLSGYNLNRANLREAYLRDVNLSGASLRCAYLGEAYLHGADLSSADLSGAWLRRADLFGVNLQGARISQPINMISDRSELVCQVPEQGEKALFIAGCWEGDTMAYITRVNGVREGYSKLACLARALSFAEYLTHDEIKALRDAVDETTNRLIGGSE